MTKFTKTFFVGVSVAMLSVVLLWAQARIQRPTNPQTGYSLGVSYSSGGNPTVQLFNGEVNVVTDGGTDAGPIVRVYDGVNAAWDVIGGEFGAGESIIFEGATANAFETELTVVDPTIDTTIVLPSGNAVWASTGYVLVSNLATNAPDVVNSIWGESNSLHFEGAGLDNFEHGIQSGDATVGDQNFFMPDNAAADNYMFMFSILDTNAREIANSIWFDSDVMLFEGTLDAIETTFTIADPTGADQSYTLPDMGAALAAKLLHVGPAAEPAFGVEAVANASSDTVYHHVFEKHWFRTAPGVAFVGVAGDAWSTTGNPNYYQHEGQTFEVDMKATVGAPNLPWAVAEGIANPVLDAENEGIEITRGITAASPAAFVIDTDQAFYLRVLATVTTVANTDAFEIGFRTVEAYQDADPEGYGSFAVIGIGDHGNAGPGDFYTHTANGGGTTSTDLGDADWVGGTTHSLEVRIAADGTTTYELDGEDTTDEVAFDFATNTVIPYIWIQADDTTNDPVIYIHYIEFGFGTGS